MYETMVEEGSTLLGELTERGAMRRGKPTRDYAHAIGHVQGQMAAARERRARFETNFRLGKLLTSDASSSSMFDV